MDTFVFFFFGFLSLAAGINVILQKKAVYGALSLITCLGALALLYLQLDAQFVAILQIIIYAGAIMVLFLFVIMLLDPRADSAPGKSRRMAAAALPLGGILFLSLTASYLSARMPEEALSPALQKKAMTMGQVESIGKELFTRYLLPFEAISVLILVAIIGAVILAKRKI